MSEDQGNALRQDIGLPLRTKLLHTILSVGGNYVRKSWGQINNDNAMIGAVSLEATSISVTATVVLSGAVWEVMIVTQSLFLMISYCVCRMVFLECTLVIKMITCNFFVLGN